jgi:hypothetical protein
MLWLDRPGTTPVTGAKMETRRNILTGCSKVTLHFTGAWNGRVAGQARHKEDRRQPGD